MIVVTCKTCNCEYPQIAVIDVSGNKRYVDDKGKRWGGPYECWLCGNKRRNASAIRRKMLAATTLLLCLSATAMSADIPDWVLRGVLKTETRSYYDKVGNIVYVDKRRGAAGERGPFQCTRAAFNQVRRKGEEFWKVEVDSRFAETIAKRYMLWLYTTYDQDWERVVEMYNAGPNNRSTTYLKKVKEAK